MSRKLSTDLSLRVTKTNTFKHVDTFVLAAAQRGRKRGAEKDYDRDRVRVSAACAATN